MFSKTEKKKAPPAKNTANTHAPSILGPDLIVTGNMRTAGDMQIDGRIEGNIHCGTLTVGERATINGEVTAESVVVRGEINGRVHARHVDIGRSARVCGDIFHESIAIETGAYLEGHCKRAPFVEPQQDSDLDIIDRTSEVEKLAVANG